MNKQTLAWLPLLVLALALILPALAHAQPKPTGMEEPAGKSMAQNLEQMKFGPLPGLPTCLVGAVEHGDPFKGPAFILAKLTPGCTIPWHWHTAAETVMMVSGSARVEMVDAEPQMLSVAAFAHFPSRHIHQFRCMTRCAVYIHTDAAFDVHYANKDGNEIPADQALKPFKETPGAAPKM